ncbi:Por secretion system C-terminal sorting domain-containing protein [Wenyingzhuangia marina]|uniref:Por secretion system C-terminal sorting domain-containing protein n=2 Tax=Wenyingzhuangia marina TaxID=1195760 RepID=A0A1M5U1V1_9FLAO|nr:Por secretion system C-terminal sorting domain-containing protein [Wenyingzhuangia marina]
MLTVFLSISTMASNTPGLHRIDKETNTTKIKESPLAENLVEERVPVIHLIGDSTVASYNEGGFPFPLTGWGQVLQNYIDESNYVINNKAIAGTSSKSFYENHWTDVINNVQAGDYVFVQFGINDRAKDPNRETDPATTFKQYLTNFVNETQAKGATCVLVSTVRRNAWNDTTPNTVYDSYHGHPVATRELAATLNIPLIDLDNKAKVLMESVGKPYSTDFIYLHLNPGEYPAYPNGKADDVHFKRMGALEMAKLVVDEIQDEASTFNSMNLLVSSLKNTHSITINKNMEDAGLVTRNQVFPVGISITLKATQNPGYIFKRWEDEANNTVSTNKLYNITTGSSDVTYNAIYEIDADCPPVTLFTKVNDGTLEKTNKAIVSTGDNVIFSPDAVEGGTWSWTGPNSFTATTKDITLNDIQTSNAGDYIVSYTTAGCVTTKTYNATVDGKVYEDGSVMMSAEGSIENQSVKISFDQKNISGYLQLYRDTDDNPAGRGRIAYVHSSATEYIDTDVVAGTTYYYWFKGADLNGKEIGGGPVNASIQGTTDLWLEAECGNTGSVWDELSDNNASNSSYVTVVEGTNIPEGNTNTAPALVNSSEPYTAAENNGRWGTLAAPWITNNAAKNHAGYGGWDDFQGFNIFNMESGWGEPDFIDGKIHQVVNLEAGNYTLNINVKNTNQNTNPQGAYFVVSQGNTGIPNTNDVETDANVLGYRKIDLEEGIFSINFTVNQTSDVSFGQVSTQSGNFFCNVLSWELTVPPNTDKLISYDFNISETSNYSLWTRSIATSTDDSILISVDNGAWTTWNVTNNSDWIWSEATNLNLTAGNHTLNISYNGGAVKLDKILISNTGITPAGTGEMANNCTLSVANFDFSSKFNINPNPVNEILTIEGIDSKQSISVFNIAGSIVKTTTMNINNNSLNVSNLLPGVYFVVLNGNNNKTTTTKFLKN